MLEIVIKCNTCRLEGLRHPYITRGLRALYKQLRLEGWNVVQGTGQGPNRKVYTYCPTCWRGEDAKPQTAVGPEIFKEAPAAVREVLR